MGERPSVPGFGPSLLLKTDVFPVVRSQLFGAINPVQSLDDICNSANISLERDIFIVGATAVIYTLLTGAFEILHQ
jgi:hypothetical protein